MTALALSPGDAEALDRVVWSSLTTRHRAFAQGGPLAVRYPATVGPFAAVRDEGPEALAALAELAADGVLALVGPTELNSPEGLTVLYRRRLHQMVLAGDPPPAEGPTPDILGTADAPEMQELAALTKPGPFLADTHRLGRYVGFREGGRLVAMAGERMRLPGFVEVSAVCTHPDHRGKGHARILMIAVMRGIVGDGGTPFLHVFDDNTGAIALYERLGFVIRATLHLAVTNRLETLAEMLFAP